MYFSVISCRRTGVRMLTSSLVSSPQRRHIFIGIPTPLLRCSITGGDMTLSIPQLRDQLRRQQSDSAPRMQTMDTEVRLVLTLARGRRQEDQLEALERGESLWRELQQPSSPVPMTSRTGMRMTLCTALRRCAIVARQREVADVWTERFAQRHNITPEDFTTGPNHVPGEVLGWQQTRPRARPGTGIDEDDIKADLEEEEEERRRGSEKKSSQDNREELSPLQRFRHEVYMDHPMMQRAFKRGAEGPGPRGKRKLKRRKRKNKGGNTVMSAENNMTVKGHFAKLLHQYEEGILRGMQAGDQDKVARSLIPQFELLWHRMSVIGVLSSNEQLDDLSTSALEFLWIPYIIADLYQRLQGPLPTPEATLSSSEPEEKTGVSREEALACSRRWFDILFQWAIDYEVVDEKTLETYRNLGPDDRTHRIELSRQRRELEEKMRHYDDQVHYLFAKRKRMQALMEEDGEELGDTNGDEEEALRNRALARLRWSIYEACHQFQLSTRELEMLRALAPEQRQAISRQHQETIEAVRRGEKSLGRHTYTILPGGLITPGGPIPTAQLNSIAMSAVANQQAFRQKVVDELMVERNTPTMTLQEFAELEMADMQRRMEASAEAKRQQEEEDERLGPDGVEERERQRDIRLTNWKEDHPPIGPTAKGNYA